jgi:hypothetical protein
MKCCECVNWIEPAQNRVRWLHGNKVTYSATAGHARTCVRVCKWVDGFFCLYK